MILLGIIASSGTGGTSTPQLNFDYSGYVAYGPPGTVDFDYSSYVAYEPPTFEDSE